MISPSSDHILSKARMLWQFGAWSDLAKLDGSAVDDSQCGEVAAFIGAAQLQLGLLQDAERNLQSARQAGCPGSLIRAILLSGAYNTLGRAHAVEQNLDAALKNFCKAVDAVQLGGDLHLIAKARCESQLSALEISFEARQIVDACSNYIKNASSRKEISTAPLRQLEPLKVFELGKAWAGNTVNTVIFRHHGIFSWGEFQYTAFYVDECILRLVRRHLPTDVLSTYDLAGEYNLRDAHNSISLGIDREGYIHLSYDHHATKLRYRRSAQPESIDAWTDELPMTGAFEERVTYPTFILPRAGFPLTLLYRDGTHNKGSARLKTYDEHTASWSDRPIPVLSGADHKPWTSNAYWNHPAIGADGSLHLSFVWRTDTLGEEKRVNNVNIGYAWTPDNGLNWFTSLGVLYKLPITQVNAEVIWRVPPGSNLINQTSMALDSLNRPHIAFYSNDANDIPQYQHVWLDGKRWHYKYFSTRQTGFDLKGGGTLQIPISRPEILIDRDDNVYAIYRGDCTLDLMCVVRLSKRSSIHSFAKAIWPESVGYAEPVIDRERWNRDQVLTMLLQFNYQSDGDLQHELAQTSVVLLDVDTNKI